MKKTKELTLQPETTPELRSEAEILISQAIDKNVPVETMEKLLALHNKIKADHAREEFNQAMAKFQRDCPIIEKQASAGASGGYNYKYATLDYIVKQVKALLAKNGFSYTFDTKKTDHSLTTFCKVKHNAGHMEVSEFEITIDTGARMNISQKDGSANTYGKRYAFCNAFGILTGDEDTDGVTPGNKTTPKVTTPPAQTSFLMTDQQRKLIFKLLTMKGKTKEDLDYFVDTNFHKSVKDLTLNDAGKVIEKLQSLSEPRKNYDLLPGQEELTEKDMDDIDAAISKPI